MRPANLLNRLRIGRAQPGGGGGVAGGERADVPALDAGLTWEAARPASSTAGSAGPRAGGSRRTGPRKWSGSTASATRASRSSLSTSISSRTTASAGATPGSSCICSGRASCPRRRARGRIGASASGGRCRAMMLHQSLPPRRRGTARGTHGSRASPPLDLIVTLDDATGAIHSAFLIEEEGTASTFRALKEVFVEHGLPMSLFTDRGAHDFRTTKAGEIDRGCPTPGRPGARTTGGRAHRSLFAP